MKHKKSLSPAVIAGIALIVFSLVIATIFITIPAAEIHPNTSSPASVSWMSEVPDDLSLSEISIPGTHNSAANFVRMAYFTKCQWDSVYSQLKEGYRILDIRLAIDGGQLITAHDIFPCRTTVDLFSPVLTAEMVIDQCLTFLKENPTETVLFIAKRETHDDISEVQLLLDELIRSHEDRWLLTDHIPTLGEARGKIVLLRRYDDHADLKGRSGIPLYWEDQGAHGITGAVENETEMGRFLVQDHYHLNVNNKWTAFTNMLHAEKTDLLRINYLSTAGEASQGHPYFYAYRLNYKLRLEDLTNLTPQWIMMDFGTEALATHVFTSNLSTMSDLAEAGSIDAGFDNHEGTDILRIILGYLKENAILLFMIATLFSIILSHRMVGNISATPLLITLAEVFFLTIFDYLELQLAQGNEPSIWRNVFSVLSYTLRPAISYSLIFMVVQNKKLHRALQILLALNFLIHFTTFWSGIAFRYTADNGFSRGPLGYTSHIVSFVNVAIILYGAFRYVEHKDSHNEVVVILCALGAVGAAIFETSGILGHVLNIVIVADCAFYYIYLYLQFSAHDSTTGLLNRQRFFTDSLRYDASITGIIAIDMNLLKEINDRDGHQAGDEGLAAIGKCIFDHCDRSSFAYRMGGDEFVVLCCNATESTIQDMVQQISEAVKTTAYSISIGYAMRQEAEALSATMKSADQAMYINKSEFYRSTGRDRRRR